MDKSSFLLKNKEKSLRIALLYFCGIRYENTCKGNFISITLWKFYYTMRLCSLLNINKIF